MPKAPAPAAADALKPTIQSAPTPMLAEEDGVVNGGVDDPLSFFCYSMAVVPEIFQQ